MSAESFVLVIDDSDQEAFVFQLKELGLRAKHVRPGQLEMRDLHQATLILVDEYLTHWPERDERQLEPSLNVRDGIALAAVLRAHLENRGSEEEQARRSRAAIVLRTGRLDRLAAGVPRALWSIAVAGRYDLEWVLQKGVSSTQDFYDLSEATANLPSDWDPDDLSEIRRWLAIPDSDWQLRALEQVEACRPPWSTLSETSDGRVWLSWFLQRILPFATFLIDDARAAAMLGLRLEAFSELASAKTEASAAVNACIYRGELESFSGRRWWRAGLTALRRSLGPRGATPEEIGQRIAELHGSALGLLEVERPVFVIDEHYDLQLDPVDVGKCVRLQPDEWPTYADDPWLLASERGNSPILDRLIVLDDRPSMAGIEGEV